MNKTTESCREEIENDENKLENVLEVLEELRKLAQQEADQIVSEAKKKAEGILQHARTRSSGGELMTEAQSTPNYYRINSQQVFRVILERERTRSDRNGHELSFIIFNTCGETGDDVTNELIKVLKTRARTVDQFGWYEPGCIGVVLPNTNNKGGLKFARDVIEILIGQNTRPPAFRVYTYPSKWMVRDVGGGKKKALVKHVEQKYIEGVDQLFINNTLPGWKRVLDVLVAMTGLVIFSPLFVMVILLIKLVSKGPVFFTQGRVGHGGRIFNFIKFRTMHVNADSSQHKNYYSNLI
jgi:ElaB/YqjD/DUF883 family membrane-anchored ribosome-binding protein